MKSSLKIKDHREGRKRGRKRPEGGRGTEGTEAREGGERGEFLGRLLTDGAVGESSNNTSVFTFAQSGEALRQIHGSERSVLIC